MQFVLLFFLSWLIPVLGAVQYKQETRERGKILRE